MRAEHEAEFAEYVRSRLPELRRAAWHLCGDPHRGDDLVQQTVTKLYLHWRKAAAASNIDAYVHRMLIHAFMDERRLGWAKVRLLPAISDTAGDAQPIAPDATAGADDRAVLRAALARLPARFRTVLVLRFVMDRPVQDVAEILRCSPGTVKSQTARGLAAMRAVLDEQRADLGRN